MIEILFADSNIVSMSKIDDWFVKQGVEIMYTDFSRRLFRRLKENKDVFLMSKPESIITFLSPEAKFLLNLKYSSNAMIPISMVTDKTVDFIIEISEVKNIVIVDNCKPKNDLPEELFSKVYKRYNALIHIINTSDFVLNLEGYLKAFNESRKYLM